MLRHENGLIYYKCGIEDNNLARVAGFSYDRGKREWVTAFSGVAKKVCRDHQSLKLLEGIRQTEKRKYLASKAISSSIEAPKGCSDKAYMDFQLAGIEYMLTQKRVLLADEMGLGKTIQAIGLCNMIKPARVLIMCPASLKLNWMSEWNEWSTLGLSVGVAQGPKYPDTDIVIINYDILVKHKLRLRAIKWDVIILDETHYLKNLKAQRTKQVFGTRGLAPLESDRVIAITGTPIVNRPIELYPIIKYLLPLGFMNQFNYARRYCNAKKTPWGYDFTGASNTNELQAILRSTIMIRRLKKDVLKELPSKTRQIIEFEVSGKIKRTLKKQNSLLINEFGNPELLDDDEFNALAKKLRSVATPGFEDISTQRKENALEKLTMVITHLKGLMETNDKIVVFAHHKEVIAAIKEEFNFESVVLVGDTSMINRDKAVKSFQNDKHIKMFIGNLKAAGVGITLTASSLVVFVESSWVPGEISQCEDRCHRMGQQEGVLVQHLVLAESMDALMLKRIIAKQRIIDSALDKFKMSDELKAAMA